LRAAGGARTLPRVSVVIGLTGGIGSGKSTVARMLRDLGATVIDADAIVHELQAPGMPMVAELAAAFGPGILTADGALDRKALGAIVFDDEAARLRLNTIVHPPVGAEFARRLSAAIAAEAPLVVLDIPLLFEGRESGRGSAAARNVEITVVVWVPEAVQIDRQMKRDGSTRAEAEQRVRAQLPLDRKRALADHVIDNSGSLAETERQVRDLYARLTATGA
jgi:dephospho-CoA kinase